MNTTNKIIKYSAIALAILLIITIFTAIINLLYTVLKGFNIIGNNSKEERIITFEKAYSYIDVDIKAANLTIKNGDKFFIETNNDKIEVKEKNDKLEIIEKGNIFLNFSNNNKSNITIYIPQDYKFDNISINAGAGFIEIENLITNNLKMDLGAGKTVIKTIISSNTEIDTGAGSFQILSGKLNNVDLDLGIGEIIISADITGKSKIDCGVGKVNLNLLNKEEYTFKFNKGVGEITLNDQKVTNDETIGNGNNILYINGGIGKISIETN